MNLDYEVNNNRFNARVSAIIYNNDKTKILLFKMTDRDFYMLPGGRIELNEDSLTAIKREIVEELGFDLNFQFCSIQENFLVQGNKKIMQYCFCYKAIYDGDVAKEKFICKDNDGQIFEWVGLKNLSQLSIKLESTLNLAFENSSNVKHIIEIQ